MIQDRNFILHKGIKSTRNGEYVGIYKSSFKISLKDHCQFKVKIVTMYFVAYNVCRSKCMTKMAQRMGEEE